MMRTERGQREGACDAHGGALSRELRRGTTTPSHLAAPIACIQKDPLCLLHGLCSGAYVCVSMCFRAGCTPRCMRRLGGLWVTPQESSPALRPPSQPTHTQTDALTPVCHLQQTPQRCCPPCCSMGRGRRERHSPTATRQQPAAPCASCLLRHAAASSILRTMHRHKQPLQCTLQSAASCPAWRWATCQHAGGSCTPAARTG
jgi:hypothetical protein